MNNQTRSFAKYASLSVIGMIGLSCYILADTFFVAQGLGTNGLAALNLAIPVYSVINGHDDRHGSRHLLLHNAQPWGRKG